MPNCNISVIAYQSSIFVKNKFCVFVFKVSDYLEVIRQPMDLSTVMTKIDTHQYLTVKDFLVDIDLICNNALEYNPDKDPGGENENYNGL